MYYFCFNICSVFSVDFFSAKYQKRNVYFFCFISVLYFTVLVSFLLNVNRKLNQVNRMENKQHNMSFKRLIMSFFNIKISFKQHTV